MLRKEMTRMYALGMLVFVTACAGGGTSDEGNAMYDMAEEPGYWEESEAAAEYDDYAEDVAGAEGDMERSEYVPAPTAEVLERQLIKNATLTFETDSISYRKRLVERSVRQYKGYVEHHEEYDSYGQENVDMTVRIPARHFDQFMEKILKGVDGLDTKSVSVDDVTDEFVDLSARIKTKKELKARFTALLDRAETIAKIMEIEREIAAIQTEIESYQGRLKFLKGSVRLATIHLSFYEKIEVVTESEEPTPFADAFERGWNGLVLIILAITHLWPFLILGLMAYLIFRYYRRRKRKAA